MVHPCLSCGACCAHFRVSFYWAEADPFASGLGAAAVPAALTESFTPSRLAMRGTQAYQPRCVALEGDVGSLVRCTVYSQRPSPCRELSPSWEQGQPSPGCDRARAAHGLPPLTPADWGDPEGPGQSPLPRSA